MKKSQLTVVGRLAYYFLYIHVYDVSTTTKRNAPFLEYYSHVNV